MKSYSHVISKLYYEPLVATPARVMSVCQVLESRLAAGESGYIQKPLAMDDEGGPSKDPLQDMLGIYGATAKINVHGTLVAHPEDIAMSECGCAMENLAACIDICEADSNIKKVIYDFRTPGGTVTKIPEVGRKILSSRKETIAFTDSECCSGGIWLASQCERFYATGSSRVGSVGVYTLCLDYSKALKKEGVKINAVSAGKYKLLGAYWEELTDEKRAIIQKGVDKIYGEFKLAMESRRVVNDENFGSGLVFDGEEAAQIGFTDGVVESIEDILEM